MTGPVPDPAHPDPAGTGPVDEPTRQRIAGDLATTYFVQAGAGSGKTSSLVSRIVHLILDGCDVRALAAITFTEAAAAELRSRVRETLEDLAAGRPVRGHPPELSPPAAARVAEALDALDEATIGTLHAFARQILADAPIAAGLPARFEVLDEVASSERFRTRWSRAYRSLIDDPAVERALRAALALGVREDQLGALASRLDDNWDLLDGLELDESPLADDDLFVDQAPLVAALAEMEDAMARCLDPDDRLHRELADKLDEYRAVARLDPDPLVVLARTAKIPTVHGGYGKAANWPDGGPDRVRGPWKAASEAVARQRAEVTDRVLRRLAATLARFTLAEASARCADGTLEFHDLLVVCRALLRSDRTVRADLHARFSYLLLDEFQDTDPIQIELAVRIAGDPSHDGTVAWEDVPVDDGRLFFVGDPKQSIYRFRRADIDLFDRTATSHGRRQDLTTNFRTVAPIVGFVNALFERTISETRVGDELAQPAYVPLAPWRTAIEGDPGPSVVVVGRGHAERVDDIRTLEALDIAGLLRSARDDAWSVDDGGVRACRWSDMTVLVPSRSSLAHLRAALEHHDIPYRLETGSLVYSTTEVRDLMSILRALADPADAVATLGALRSPAYACGDDELLRWYRAHGTWDLAATDGADRPGEDPHATVRSGLGDLDARRRRWPSQTVAETVEEIVRERGLETLAALHPRQRDVQRLYRIVSEHAREHTEAGGTLRTFLDVVALRSDDKVRASAPVLPEADLDAVRIMTIHAAKGLEFPITAVSGLCGQIPNAQRGPALRIADGAIEVSMRRDVETAAFDLHRTVEDVMGAEESQRLLYVACTRARDHLILSAHHKDGRHKGHGKRIAEECDDLASDLERLGVVRIPGGDGPATPGGSVAAEGPGPNDRRPPAPERSAAAQAWSERVRALEVDRSARAATPTTITASSLERHGDPTVSDGRPGLSAGGNRAAVGAAVHDVLQRIDPGAVTPPDDLVRWAAAGHAVVDHVEEIAALVASALGSVPWIEARDAPRRWRELHVALPAAALAGRDVATAGAPVFEGFVDLLYERGDGLVVVDYKTDAVGAAVRDGAVLDGAAERHRLQLAAYAEAVAIATGRAVVDAVVLFLTVDGARPVSIPGLDRARDDARARVAELLDGLA